MILKLLNQTSLIINKSSYKYINRFFITHHISLFSFATYPYVKHQKGLFKKSSSINNKTQPEVNKQINSHDNLKDSDKLRHLEENNTKQQRNNESYNFRTCEMILNKYKDFAKQSRSVDQVIKAFRQHQRRLQSSRVNETQLRDKYKPVLYAGLLRTFGRILRRQHNPQMKKMIQFLQSDYKSLQNLHIQTLNTLQLSDFVSFFFLFELLNKFKNFSQTKLIIVDKYLQELYHRYSKHKLTIFDNQKQVITDQQRNQKRYLSQIISAARCAQIFQSPLYSQYLNLLLQHINQKKLVPYKIVSIVKFILRTQNLTSIQQQHILLDTVLKKMKTQDILVQFDYSSLRQLYGNLSALIINNQYLFDMKKGKKIIQKMQDFIIKILPNVSAEQVFMFTIYSLKNHTAKDRKLAKYIFKYILSQINSAGQTSLNPLFILQIFSCIDKQINLNQIDLQWQDKLIKMYNKYLIGKQSLQNLAYCSEYQVKLYKQIQSTKIQNIIINSFLSQQTKSIIPYDCQSILLQNYYLEQNNNQKIIASLYRLKQARFHIDKKKGLYNNIFQKLQSKFSQEMRKQVLQKDKAYIQGFKQIRRNKQGYIRTISKYCQSLGQQQLITDLFYESLLSILSDQQQKPIQKTSLFSSKKNKTQSNLSQTLDQKNKQKVNGLIFNYISVLVQLSPQMTKSQPLIKIQQKIKDNKFLQYIKGDTFLSDIFIESLTLKQTSMIIYYAKQDSVVEFLLKALQFLTIGFDKQIIYRSKYEKYYFTFYSILKNYPIQKLSKIINTQNGKVAIEKILSISLTKKLKGKGKGRSLKSQITKQQVLKQQFLQEQIPDIKNKISRANFIYNSQTDKVVINSQHLQILKKRVNKCMQT